MWLARPPLPYPLLYLHNGPVRPFPILQQCALRRRPAFIAPTPKPALVGSWRALHGIGLEDRGSMANFYGSGASFGDGRFGSDPLAREDGIETSVVSRPLSSLSLPRPLSSLSRKGESGKDGRSSCARFGKWYLLHAPGSALFSGFSCSRENEGAGRRYSCCSFDALF